MDIEHEDYESPVTMGDESSTQIIDVTPKIGHLLPGFHLKSVDGKMVSPWDFKERQNLLVVFFNPRSSDDLQALAEINHRYHEITDENAEVLAVGSGPVDEIRECIASFSLQFPLLSDSEGKAACEFGSADSMIYVADKFGELKMKSTLSNNLDATLTSAINILDLAELECPECGVTTWPEER